MPPSAFALFPVEETEVLAMEEVEQRIFLGSDSRDMQFLDDKSVHLVVTSPPYWQLKDYGTAEQIGFHDSYETYINDLNLVWAECARVLKPGCRVAINVGDQFARAECYGRYKVIPIRTEIIRCLESLGLDHMGSIIWRKVTTCNTSGGASVMGSFPTPRNGVVKLDYEFILLFKKPGRTPPPSKEAKENSKMTTEEWNQYFSGHWEFPGEKQVGHIAMFPEELPKRLIRMFSFPGEVVLDPFFGSGTTMVAARDLGRGCTGVELNVEFEEHMTERLGISTLFPGDHIEFIRADQESSLSAGRLAALKSNLPYLFVDPVVMDKPKKRSTKNVRPDGKPGPETVGVEEVVSGQEVRLSDGRQIVLRGIELAPKDRDAARKFLVERLKGQRVFTKHSVHVGNKERAYLLLKNRTNLNAHLIKLGIATCDNGEEHPMKSRFVQYENQAQQ